MAVTAFADCQSLHGYLAKVAIVQCIVHMAQDALSKACTMRQGWLACTDCQLHLWSPAWPPRPRHGLTLDSAGDEYTWYDQHL